MSVLRTGTLVFGIALVGMFRVGWAVDPPPIAPHLIPAEKNLPRGWVEDLYTRGEKEVWRRNALDLIGMPVGGIGTGQLYLCGEGALGNWEIFNRFAFRGTGDTSYRARIPERAVDQGFAVVIQGEDKRVVRTLNRHGFSDVAFNGQYPVGTITYHEDGLPIEVELQAFSPFIPLNAKDSALPATVFHVTLRNKGTAAVNAGVLAWLENAVCRYTAEELPGLRRTRIINEKGRTLLVHTAEEPPKAAEAAAERPPIMLQDFEGDTYGEWKVAGEAFGAGPAKGAFPGQQPVTGFAGKGLANSFTGGDDSLGTLTSPPFTINRNYINLRIGGGNYVGETCVNLIVDDGVVRTAVGDNTERLVWRTWKVADLDGKEAHIEIVDRKKGGWGHINVDDIELSDTRWEGPIGPVTSQDDWGTLALAYAEESGDPQTAQELLASVDGLRNKRIWTNADPYPFPERRNAALLSARSDIAPGGQRTFTFVLAWHTPNAQNGHEYAARFADAPAVAHYVLDNHDRLTADTLKWRDTYYDSSLPYWLLDRLHSTVSYLCTGTAQWWQNGRFYAYEGVVCCHGTCTHVWNYAHTEARLFPELARSTREMQDFSPAPGGFHPDTGLVGFRSDNAYAADGQCGTILKAYREHTMSADGEFLKRVWPQIKKALEYSIQQDGNDDGLIENTQPNTYDINFEGANTFVGSLYLAALRAGEAMAREMGDAEFADRCKRIFESGSRLSVERLWDGEYFIQTVDLKQFPRHQYGPGCLSDQLFGQGWARQLALGAIYPEANVKQALASIWKYNWATDIGPYNEAHKPLRWFVSPGEAGLITCTWPKSAYLDQGVIYKEEVWTGIEYQVAGNMIWDGLLEEGLAVCRAIHDRYHPLKRNPYNEVECGDHYGRAMASWGVFTALAGYEYHGPKGHLGFAPRITPENFKAAFTAAEGWGSFSQKRADNAQQDRVEIRWGKLRLKTLAFTLSPNVPAATVAVTISGNPVAETHILENGRLVITLTDELTLNPGEAIDVNIQ